MRRKSKIKEDLERYSIIRTVTAVERADVVIVVIDAIEGVTEQDAKIAGIAHDLSLIHILESSLQVPVHIVKSGGYDLVDAILHPEHEKEPPVYAGYEPERIFEHRPGQYFSEEGD